MKKHFNYIFLLVLLLSTSFLISCSISRKVANEPVTINSLRFINLIEVPFDQQFKETTIGGLSGIDYDSANKVYYFISDDRSNYNPARFYTANINLSLKGIENIQFLNVTTLPNSQGRPFPDSKKDPAHSCDPEGIRYNSITKQLVWTSEGERIVKKDTVLQDPSINIISTNGTYISQYSIPTQMHAYATEKGIRQNGVFEGLTFADNFKTMYVSVEEPLYEDGPRAGLKDTVTWTRIIKYDAVSKKQVAQYAYHPEPIAFPPTPSTEFKINGIPDILSLGKDKLLVIERSFSTGVTNNTIKVFIANIAGATNIADRTSLVLQNKFIPISKKLLLNMDDLGFYIDNVEGVTFGPTLPNGHRTLIFVADNNFAKHQKTQLLLFEVL